MAFIFSCSSHCEPNSKTTSYVTLLSNSMGLTFGQERKNISARWNKSLMLPLCLNMDWLHIYSKKKKNLVQNASQSMSRSKLSQNLQILSAAVSENKFLHCCFVYTFLFLVQLIWIFSSFFFVNLTAIEVMPVLISVHLLYLFVVLEIHYLFTKVWYLKVHHRYYLETTTIQSLSTLLLY